MMHELSIIIAITILLSTIALTTQAISATTTARKTEVNNAIDQYFANANVTPPPPEKIIALAKQIL